MLAMRVYEQQGEMSYQCGACQRDVTVAVSWRWFEEAAGALAAVCSNCRTVSVFNVGSKLGQMMRPDGGHDMAREVKSQLPSPSLSEYSTEIVPEPVARRYRDAQRAMQRELWEQAISTARTAVQVMARLEDVKRGRLYDEIERLIEKRGDELPELVKKMAHQIRDSGNDALHPDDPNWQPTEEEAKEALALLQAVIEWLYAMPARLKRPEGAEQVPPEPVSESVAATVPEA
jgi:Domain of unknown function (DUF4145)